VFYTETEFIVYW